MTGATGTKSLAAAAGTAPQPVSIEETADAFTLSNGVLSAKIDKKTGGMRELHYEGKALLKPDPRHASGYWSHAPAGERVSDSITIDPKTNAGARGEVSIKATFSGKPLGGGPGGSVAADIEIRYALAQGDSALYTYCIFDHKPAYPATSIGEARFALKLNASVFDWMTIDARRNKLMASPADWENGTQLNMKEARRLNSGIYAGQVEHKYDYSAVQFDTPAFGWSGTKSHLGLWLINPSNEYLSGGATKVELTGHLDNNGGAPTLLNYWRGSHYGASRCDIAAGESWKKVVGPFLIYCNAGATPDAMWSDALGRAKTEGERWPYEWVAGVDYPRKAGRGTVTGQIILDDPQAPAARMSHLLVGLAWPDVPSEPGGRERAIGGVVDWQQDAKHYEFWTRAAADGTFTIPNIRPGIYTLHAIADGVLGEFSQANVIVKPGESLNLGKLQWTPVRFGRQIWEIGIPDRTAGEFRHGDHYWQWGLYNDDARDFPNGVNFIIDKSDFHAGWNYAQVPRPDKPTTWTISFDLPEAPRGKATLRIAFASNSAKRLDVTMNGQPAGALTRLPDTATIRRDGIRGYWFERDVAFDAGLMKKGKNVLGLTIPAANVLYGVEYDYLRLEMAEDGKAGGSNNR
ncbi:MAG TPA: polysaccharide lyase family protein [Tepidisphaeraceae bacterium]|jgi:rhamnogalacturonan endolyase|nr:polysaccharide lyase family protein [Tepidisphaeraceae bacterium]